MGYPAAIFLPPQDPNTVRLRDTGTAPPPSASATPGAAGTQQPAPGSQVQDPYAGCYGQLPLLIAIPLLFYFLLIRPQQKQDKQRREMLNKLARGDRVVTTSGIHGVVSAIGTDTIELKVDTEGKVKITVDRTTVGRVVSGESSSTAPAAKE